MIMWAIQILLAVAFGAAGTMKLVRSKAQLAANPHMGWVHSVPEAQIKLLGVAEVLGAIGLVAPMATGIVPSLTRAGRCVPGRTDGRSGGDAHEPSGARGRGNRPGRIDDRRGNVPMIVGASWGVTWRSRNGGEDMFGDYHRQPRVRDGFRGATCAN